MEQSVTRISKWVQRIEEVLLSIAILGLAVLVIANILVRFVNKALAWLAVAERISAVTESLDRSQAVFEEVSEFLVIAVTFIGLSYAASKGRHIRMTALYDQLSQAHRKLVMIFITAVTSALMFALCVFAVRYVLAVYQLGGIYPALRVPFYAVYLVAPLGFFLAGIQYLLALIRNIFDAEVYLSFEKKDEYDEPVKLEI